ncbi:MAG: penicillin-binding protein 2, partial [Xanthomonadales bacterium]|nr:penicillin-binding protein 2 [Xanthomonadales bacterium]
LTHADRLPALAKALGMDVGDLEHDLRQRTARDFVYLQRQLPPSVAKGVMDLKIPGVHQQREYKRFYPSGAVAAHVLGFTNIDDKGQEGLELAFQSALSGSAGAKRVIRDRHGQVVENVDMLREPQPGRDLVLSIDQRIQYLAFRDLQQSVKKHVAMSGSVVVMDVHTGEILAMVNQPSFNPNNLDGSRPAQRRNRAVTDVMEPGSVMKPFTIAAALEGGKWTRRRQWIPAPAPCAWTAM